MLLLGILVSLLIFSIIVLIHEYGHYKTAKIFNIHVEEFGLGIPPRAKKLWKNKAGTLFSLNWIPLGGFVKIAGESEVQLSYYNSKKKKLSLTTLSQKLKKDEDIYDIEGKNISKAERKYLEERLKNINSGKNFYEKNIFQKSAVLLAGVIMNFIGAIIIFSALFFIGVRPVGINSFIPQENSSLLIPTLEQSLEIGIISEESGFVLYPLEDSIAQKSGIIEGDIIEKVNGENITSMIQLQEAIFQSASIQIQLSISGNINGSCINKILGDEKDICMGAERDIFVTPNPEGKIGTYIAPNYVLHEDFKYKFSAGESVSNGLKETYAQIRLTIAGLKMLGKNILFPKTPEDREDAIDKVAGPIGIVGLITDSLQGGILLLCIIAGIISVNLGVFNLLPIPALDGGRLLLLWMRSLVDTLFGKNSISETIENMTHLIFFLLLIALSILIAYNDIIKILSE